MATATALWLFALSTQAALAQSEPDSEPTHQQDRSAETHGEHSTAAIDESHGGSGTARVPATRPLYGRAWQFGNWQLMAHGAAFLQFLHEDGPRGSYAFAANNWIMLMGERRVGRGRIRARGAASLEPWTIRGCGYPNQLASGELCGDEPIADRQHPHDLLMEAAVQYDRPLRSGLAVQLYAGLAGEPALGPVAYSHRLSAMSNPISPTFHHWVDATHITFGVATVGLYSRGWKGEVSLFNGREPDEHRYDLDFGPFDSWSLRVSWVPTAGLAVQVSTAHLEEAEAQSLHDGGARFDVDRTTASLAYHRRLRAGGLWATTTGWGRNVEILGRTDALLVETNVTCQMFCEPRMAGAPSLVESSSLPCGLRDSRQACAYGSELFVPALRVSTSALNSSSLR